MTHIFDLRTIFLAKHAQHIVLIHFPIALFLMSVVFDLLATMRKDNTLRVVAYYNLFAAAVSSIIAGATGVLAWQIIYGGGNPKGIILFHLIGASTTMVLLWLLTVLRFRRRRNPVPGFSKSYILLTALATIVIMLTGHLGGILSGVTQLGE